MTARPDIAAQLAAALDWWREAGIDCAFTEEPQDWLAGARPATKPAAAQNGPPVDSTPAPPPLGGVREGWPATLEAFAPWWIAESSLAPAGAIRVPPRGPVAADLMILVTMPLADDADTLLSGRGGRMVDAMLAAMGLQPDSVYLASALPARIAMPDWAALSAQGLGAVLAHHVALVSPRRLLVFGQKDISSLLGHNPPQNGPILRSVDHEQGSVPAIAAADFELVLSKGSLKAQLWNRWLDWTGTEQP